MKLKRIEKEGTTDNTQGVVIWDDERDEDKREGELLQMNGKRNLIKSKRLVIFKIYTK